MGLLPNIESLSLAQQVAQMVVIRTTGHLFDHEIEYPQWEADWPQLEHCIRDLGVGGVILLGGSAAEVGVKTQQLQALALQSATQIPLLVSADIEEGVGQRFSGATWFPPPMALGAIAQKDLSKALTLAEAMGRVTAQEAAAVGINWLLAPVVDVNNNPANPVINVRAFGDNPEIVSQLTQSFIRGAQDFPVLTTAKHFPGHGDTATDSHLALPVICHDLERLEQIELSPFKDAIATGVDSIMTAHLLLKNIDAQYPATLSKATLTGLLRQDLHFEGLIVTDALVMGAITEQYGPYEAAVLAVEAGADILLMPADAVGAIEAVCEAVRIGRLSATQITHSLERLWRAKHKIIDPNVINDPSCHAWEHRTDAMLPQWEALSQPSARQTQTAILKASMAHVGVETSASDDSTGRATTPLPTVSQGLNLILVEDVVGCRYLPRTAPALTQPARHGYVAQLIDSHWPVDTVLATQGSQPTLLQLFIRGNPFRSSASLIELAQSYVTERLKAHALAGVIIYGSPYVAKKLGLPETVPCWFSYGQMPEAQALALQAVFGNGAKMAVDSSFTD